MPLDRSQVQKMVDVNIKTLQKKFGLERWLLKFNYDPSGTDDDGSKALGGCNALIDYEDARIDLNPEGFDTTDEALSTLRHELMHIILSPMDLYLEMVQELELSDETKKLLARGWKHSLEKTILNLQRMYDGLTAIDASGLRDSHS